MTGTTAFAVERALPADWRSGRFVGRVDRGAGPCVVLVRDGHLIDVTAAMPTVAAFAAAGAPADLAGEDLGPLEALQLSAEPDAALHGILVPLLTAAQALKADPAKVSAVADMRAAIAHYPHYFDDPGWDKPVPVEHVMHDEP